MHAYECALIHVCMWKYMCLLYVPICEWLCIVYEFIFSHWYLLLNISLVFPCAMGNFAQLQGRIGGSAYSLYKGTIEANSLECPVYCHKPPIAFGSACHLHVFVYMFLCMCMCVHVRMCVRVWHVYMCICLYMGSLTYASVYMQVYMCIILPILL